MKTLKVETVSREEDDSVGVEDPEQKREVRSLVRTTKNVVVRPAESTEVDYSVVSPRFFNCFNYSVLAQVYKDVNLSMGITSSKAGEGKTLVATNIAVSLAIANERDTVLVDFNLQRPRIHELFFTDIGPGLTEALTDTSVFVTKTRLKHLYLLTAGSNRMTSPSPDGLKPYGSKKYSAVGETDGMLQTASLNNLSDLRDVIYSLQQKFEIIIIDMPPALDPGLPVIVVQQMHGVLLVVDSQNTKKEEPEKVFQRIGKDRVLGFVLNRMRE